MVVLEVQEEPRPWPASITWLFPHCKGPWTLGMVFPATPPNSVPPPPDNLPEPPGVQIAQQSDLRRGRRPETIWKQP